MLPQPIGDVRTIKLKMANKINKARFFAQSRTKSLKYLKPLEAGTKLTIVEVIEGSIPRKDQPDLENDRILVKTPDGELVKIDVRDYSKMTVVGDNKLYNSEDDSEDLLLPISFTIASSEDRMYNEKPLYPLFAYKGAQDFLNANQDDRDFDALVEAGPMEGSTHSPVQNYTISID